MNIDCQIRGKSDVHEALASLCETEIMEGNNQVFCDNCKKNTDTVLRTTISDLPNMMILSLKRFDLDYTTFETVKLNSRCAFGQTLNMKRYTLEGVEAMEQAERESEETDAMDIGTEENIMKHLPDEDYEYKLAGVLVHAGVAQGGHYYSFIKDRSDDKWYRFDDEDITPFDPASIEVECFGGKVKKETKWPNGQVHTVEQEQYANALMLFYEKVKPKQQPSPPEEEKEESEMPDLTNIKMTTGYDVFEPDVRRSNATHRWQSFLFDTEFQEFLSGLLRLCRVSVPDGSNASPMETVGAPALDPDSTRLWRKDLTNMLLTFLFDVLFYSNERVGLADWILRIERIMASDKDCAKDFVATLAVKVSQVSSNWLRTYLLDCPDPVARHASVHIFSKAVQSALTSQGEPEKLGHWMAAWKEQLAKEETAAEPGPPPPMLLNEWAALEDVIQNQSSASAIGLILSFTNCLVDAIPRSWKFSPELFLFIRNLAATDSSQGGNDLREAMILCLLPPRLICIVGRARAPTVLKSLFPAASLASEVADTQLRPEQNHHSHQMMSMTGNQVMNSADMNFRGGNTPTDYVYLFEAVGCLMSMTQIVQAPLIVEQEEQGRGRNRIVLTEPARLAFTEIFRDNCSEGTPGMGQDEIRGYLGRLGLDNISSQKIMEMMAKYPTPQGTNGYLSVEGFLAEKAPSLGDLGDVGMRNVYFYEIVCTANEELGEYMLASACLRTNPDVSMPIIGLALRLVAQAANSWNGNEYLSVVVSMLKVVATIPDGQQSQRIRTIMLYTDQSENNRPRGLLAAGRIYHSRAAQSYQQDIVYAYDRYVQVVKELFYAQSVSEWMSEHRDAWSFMERELFEPHHHVGHGQSRGGYAASREPDDGGLPLDHHHHSDSDGMHGIHDSEDDEESRMEEMELYNDGPAAVVIEGAGNKVVNGTYARDG
ncbi:MAG: hypothetical protein SGILL_002107, partial [Bacillariaceae sp.]